MEQAPPSSSYPSPPQTRLRSREARQAQRAAQRAERQPVVTPGLPGGQYKPLTQRDIQRIHDASLTVLEHTGIEVMPSECRELFRAAGARVDDSANRVFIPRQMVEKALTLPPKEVRLCGRDPQHDMLLGDTRVYMGTGGAAVKVLDLESGQARESTLQDVADFGRLADALDNIHFYLRACVARDIPVDQLDINTYYAAAVNTTKHVTVNAFSVQSVRDIVEMAGMILSGVAWSRSRVVDQADHATTRLRDLVQQRPIVSFTNCWTVSPLRYAPETVEVLTEIVRQGIPVFTSSAPQAGATSPAALAGTLVQINAEELSGVVYTQIVRPGAPIVLGYVPAVADLRTGSFSGGAAEFALMNAAAAQLGQFYGLPVYNSSHLTDAKIPDIQAGYEKGITGTMAALAGSNYIHHAAGFLESLLTVAYEQYVIDDDINGSILRALRGIEVTDETLSVDVIDAVCKGEGHFLGSAQSLALMNSEYYYPHTADRRSRAAWEEAGALDMREAARRKARHLLATHHSAPIPAALDTAIRQRWRILLPPALPAIETTG
ncbi:MAG: methyltransferase [Caldilinea sp. CFX5]|nr:methyltransferase [Caldilinea sp. CFX5]